MKLERVQKVPVLLPRYCFIHFFGAYLNFLKTRFCIHPHARPSRSASAAETPVTRLSHRQGERGIVRRTSNTKPPSFPSQKQTIALKRKYSRSTDRRGYNNCSPLTSFESIRGSILAAGLMLPALELGAKPNIPQQRALQHGRPQPREQTLQTAEEAARSCMHPIARDGEAAAVSSPRNCAASLLLAHSFLGSNGGNDPRQRQRGDDGEKEQRWDGEGTH